LVPKHESLLQIPLFAGLSESEVQALAQRTVERRFAPDEMLFWEGEPCAGMFLLIEGSAKIFKTSANGREMMLALETAPTTVAELPLFDGGPYPASVRAVDPVVALFINKADFQQVCRQFPDVALKVLAVVGKRLRQLVGLVESMTFGFISSDTLGDDYYQLNAAGNALVGRRKHRSYELNGRLDVVVDKVDRFKRIIDFRPA